MSLPKNLVSMLCCPETHQSLSEMDEAFVESLNGRIQKGEVTLSSGEPVSATVDGVLLREDKKVLYAIREDIPVLLVDEALLVPAGLI